MRAAGSSSKFSPVCPTFNVLLAIGWHERGSPASSDDGSSTAAAVSGRGKLRFGVPHFQTNHDKPVCTDNIPPLIPNFGWAAHGLKILKDHGPELLDVLAYTFSIHHSDMTVPQGLFQSLKMETLFWR